MAVFKYPKLIAQLSESADAAEADIDDFTTDLIHFVFMAQVQEYFDEEGQLVDRDGLVVGSGEFVKRVIMAVAHFTAAFCGEPTEEDDITLQKTKH